MLDQFRPLDKAAADEELETWLLNCFLPSWENVNGEENMEWRGLEKKIEVAEKTEDANDLFGGRRMRSVGLILGLGYKLGLQVACIEENHVTKSCSGEKYMGSNLNHTWDPGTNTAQRLEGRAGIKIIWVGSGPTPSGDPVKGSISHHQLVPYFTDIMQIHPVVSHLCASLSIQGTSLACLADYLGLHSPNFQNKSREYVGNDLKRLLLYALNDEDQYRGWDPLILSCPSCLSTFNYPPILSSICALISQKQEDTQAGSAGNFLLKLQCSMSTAYVSKQGDLAA